MALVKYHNFQVSEIEDMMPWERLVYVDLIATKMKEEEMEKQDAAMFQRDMAKLAGRGK